MGRDFKIEIDNTTCTETPNMNKPCIFRRVIWESSVGWECKPSWDRKYVCDRYGECVERARKVCKLKEIVIRDE